jgi:N-acetylmuramoyl-L-alanine amidase
MKSIVHLGVLALFLLAAPAWGQLAGRKVVIDPGHGGTDPGALGYEGGAWPNEEDFVLDCSHRVRTMLQNAGCTVVMTRTTDATVSLTARRDLINNQNPNCAFSIHCNSFSDSAAHGTETFWWSSGNSLDQSIASKVQTRLLQKLGRFNRGVKQANFTVTTANPPVCLSECLFISNPTEFNIVNSESGKQNWASAHYLAVGDFLGINLDAPVNNAAVVSMSYPSTVTVGQQFSATITMNNNGTKPWTSDATAHALGSQNPQDNARWGTGRIGLPFQPVNGGQNASFTFTFTAPTTAGTYPFDWRMVEDGVQWFGATAVGSINVIVNPPAITGQPASLTRNPGETATFTVTATGTGPLSYQWRKNGVNITGATASSLALSNVQLADAAFYTVVVSNAGGSVTSQAAQLAVTSSGSGVGTGTGLRGSYFDNMDFTVLRVERTDATVNFQWGAGSPDPSVAADTFSARWIGKVQPRYTQTYSFYTQTDDGVRLWVNGQLLIDKWVDQGGTEWSGTVSLTAGQQYDIQMDYYENGGGAAAVLLWSSASQLKEAIPQTQLYPIQPPTITTQPQGQTVSAGANVTFSVVASGSAPLSYQWRFNGANISGATGTSHTRNNVQFADGGSYSVVVSNPGGSVTSANATLTVNSPPAITAQPQSQSVNAGANVTLSVSATGSAPLSYQWRFNGANIATGTTSSLARNNVQAADIGYYSVVVSNPFGTVTSSDAVLSLNSANVLVETFESGNLNAWTVAPAATALAISTAQNHTSPGANSAQLSSSANKMYRNLGSEVEGRARATFWIYDDNGAQTRWFGEARSYTGAGFGSGGLDQLFAIGRYSVGFGTGTGTLAGEVVNTAKYQGRVVSGANTGWFNLNANRATGWHKFEIERAADGTTISFYVDGVLDRTISGATASTWDSVTIGSLGSGTTAGNAWFDDVSVDYFGAPAITTQPASQTVSSGTTATLSVVATPNISSYQWRKNGANISGATAASLVFNNVQQTDAGTYSVLVRNGISFVTSANATLTVTETPPTITSQPQSQTVFLGDTVTFSATATGSQPFSYQWRKNGANISGANGSSYSKSNVQSSDAGNYSVVVSNPIGSATSSDAVLTVNGNTPPVLGAIGNKTGNENSAITFTATATDANAGDILTFSLDAGAPASASINPSSGAFSWTPTEVEGPGTYVVTVRVTDNGTPVQNDSESITITVNEVNSAPILTLGTALATEPVVSFETVSDFVNDHVMFRKPANSSTTSAFLDSAVTNYANVVTSFPAGNPRAGAKMLKASWSFLTGTTNPWLRFNTFNSILIPNPTIELGARLKFEIHTDKAIKLALGVRETGTAAAIGANGGTTGAIEWLGATKVGSSPVPSRVIPANTWTTVEFNLPAEVCTSFNAGNNVLATGRGVLEHLAIVPDGGAGVYTVHVDNFEVVTATALPGTITMNSGSSLTFTASSSDSDSPAQTLAYSLDAGAPAGAGINSGTGAFTWTPTSGQTGSHNLTARVTDNGPGALSDGEIFTVTVSSDPLGVQSAGEGSVAAGESVTLTWDATVGATYQVQYLNESGDWIDLGEPVVATEASAAVEVANDAGATYYRVISAEAGSGSE